MISLVRNTTLLLIYLELEQYLGPLKKEIESKASIGDE